MSQFSIQTQQAIRDFIGSLQMADVTPAADGSYSFAFEETGVLSFTPSADGKRTIIALKAESGGHLTAGDMLTFLGLAQRDATTQLPITAGMVGGAPVLAANVPNSSMNLQKIETCFDQLIKLHPNAN